MGKGRWLYFEPLIFLAILGVPWFANNYVQYVVNLVLVYWVIAGGLNLLLGYTGQLALSHPALMGVGAYATAILTTRLSISFWIALPLSGLIAALFGTFIVLPALRVQRVYLSLATLALTEVMTCIFIHWTSVTMGTDGIPVKPPTLFGWRLGDDRAVFFVIFAVAILCHLILRRILVSGTGRAFVAIRENEIMARANGINIARTKALAFALSAFFAGIGGSLFALTTGFISPNGFGMFQVILQFSMVMIGGLGSISGSLLGAAVLTVLPEAMREFEAFQEMLYGAALVLFVMFMPEGIIGFFKSRGWLSAEVLAPSWRRFAVPREG
jgi:branched-chain amino acid transport system permease protein